MLAHLRVRVSLILGALISTSLSQENRPAYRDPSLPAQQRANDLLKRMTLEEKVDQLRGGRRTIHNANGAEEKQIFEDLGKPQTAVFRSRA